MDGFEGYERFTYKRATGGDLAPPHCIWDNAKNGYAEAGSFSTEEEACACAYGMNKGREMCRQTDRTLQRLLADLQRAARSVESIMDNE